MLKLSSIRSEINTHFSIRAEATSYTSGQMVALLGGNGSGKSSFLKMLAGDYHFSGTYELHSKDVNILSSEWKARHIGMLSQQHAVHFPLTVQEVVEIGSLPLKLSSSQRKRAVQNALQRFECEHHQHQMYTELSGGQQQRVQLARVVLQVSQAQEPPILLLDEPLSAQDLAHQYQILERLRALSQAGYLIFISVHDLNQALRYADSGLIFEKGEVMEQGSIQGLLTPKIIQRYWNYRTQKVLYENLEFLAPL